MSSEPLISVLEEIRDQQKQQLVNYEQALEAQKVAAELQRRGRKLVVISIAMPWIAMVVVLLILFFGPPGS